MSRQPDEREGPPRDPLLVSWLEPAWFVDGLQGRLGVTFLPGKRGASMRYPGRFYDRELTSDLADLRDAGIRRLILLIEDHELERWGSVEIIETARDLGVEVIRRPIRDGGVPRTAAEMDEIVALVNETRATGANVAVACLGGVGRAGTVAACALIGQGLPAGDAVARVREARHPACIETRAQLQFVAAYADRAATARESRSA